MKKHILPELPYQANALEPYIDAKTMEIHHGKHHATYVVKLNEALEKHAHLFDVTLEELLRNFASIPEDIKTAVRNHGGGHHQPSGQVVLHIRTHEIQFVEHSRHRDPDDVCGEGIHGSTDHDQDPVQERPPHDEGRGHAHRHE